MKADIDILMITYNRAAYTKLALARLLDTCDHHMRVWVWHNGKDAETLRVVEALSHHPRLYRFMHSLENMKLNAPTNWLWRNAEGSFLSKVDDDCLMPSGWAETLRAAHRDNPGFGVLGCWRFPEEDFAPQLAHKKIQEFNGGHRLMRNCWIEGSGYLMKRQCVDRAGPLRSSEGFTTYCIRLARQGWIHGWHYPFLYQEHFDDPRSKHSLLRNDSDIRHWAPLSAINNGVKSVDEWQTQLRRSARLLQSAPYDPKFYTGWRRQLKRVHDRIKRAFGIRKQW